MTVAIADGMYKLSQEKSSDIRTLVADSFADRESNVARGLADLIRRVGRAAVP